MNATTDVEGSEDEVDDDGSGDDGRQDDKDGSRSVRVVFDPGDTTDGGDRADNGVDDTDVAVEVLVVTTVVCLSFMTRFIRIRPIRSDLERRYETGKKKAFSSLLVLATKLRPLGRRGPPVSLGD